MKTQSLKLTFKAPIVFKYEYTIDIDEIEDGDIDKYLLKIIKEDKKSIADAMYQLNKEDLSHYIQENIYLDTFKESYRKKNEFDF